MECHIGLRSEFKDVFAKYNYSQIYDDSASDVGGVTNVDIQESWVFVDRIMFREDWSFRDDVNITIDFFAHIVNILAAVTSHELIHLCGIRNEAVVEMGEKMLIWPARAIPDVVLIEKSCEKCGCKMFYVSCTTGTHTCIYCNTKYKEIDRMVGYTGVVR